MTAYYNEIDPQAAQWLRNLIAAGHIALGDVDTRSIKEVQPDDLKGYTQCHFFAGIGVWSYALRRAGWSDDRPVWTGSCPCQPFSAAGKGEGLDDPRHLWPDWRRLIRARGEERRAVPIFGEQVAGPDGYAWLDLARADLEEDSYTVGAIVTCSAGFGGPDIRHRLYWVAHAERGASERHGFSLAGAARGGEGEGHQRQRLRDEPRYGGDAGGVADAGHDGGAPRRARREYEPESPIGEGSPGDGATRRVGDTPSARRQGSLDQDVCGAWGRSEGRGATSPSIPPCGLADADGGLKGDGGVQRGGQHGLEPQDGRVGRGSEGPGPLNGFWRVADWLLCTDGKWRPVEPCTFPLDTGIAGRLVRLRAYGNALNAESATEFIAAAKAELDVIEQSNRSGEIG